MGTHISKMRSAILDVRQWTPELLDVFANTGNEVVNSILERPEELAKHGVTKPTTDSPRPEKERYIRAKYETKQFIGTIDDVLAHMPASEQASVMSDAAGRSESDRVGLCLMHSCIKGDLPTSLKLILLSTSGGGAKADAGAGSGAGSTPAVLFRDPAQSNLSPLHIASAGGHNALIELLLLNGANVDELGGGDGGSALHLAVLTKKVDTCQLLITKGAQVGIVDVHGRTAVDIALEQARPVDGARPDPSAAIISGILRLAKAAQDDAQRVRDVELAERERYASGATGDGETAAAEAAPPIPTTAPPATPTQLSKGAAAAAAAAAATPVPHTPGEKD
jgi:hypothetical protein